MDAVTDHPYQLPAQTYRDQLGSMVGLQQVVGQTTVANSVSSIGSSVSPTANDTSNFSSLASHWTPTGKYQQQQHHVQHQLQNNNNNNNNNNSNSSTNNNNNNNSSTSLACAYSPQASDGGLLAAYDGQQFSQFLGGGLGGDVGLEPETNTVTNPHHPHHQQPPQPHHQQQHQHHQQHQQHHHQQPHHQHQQHQNHHSSHHHQHSNTHHRHHHTSLAQQELTAAQEQQQQQLQEQQQQQHYGGGHHTIDSTTLGPPSVHGGQGGKKSVDKGSDEYKKRRERNNVAVRKSREKAKMRSRDTERRVAELAKENQLYRAQYEELRREFNVLKSLLLKTGLTEQVIEEEAHGAYPILASQHHQQTRVVSGGLPPHPSSSWLE